MDWLINIAVALASSLITWLVTCKYYENILSKKALLILKNELNHNKDIMKSYLTYYEANKKRLDSLREYLPSEFKDVAVIDTEHLVKLRDKDWQENKSELLLNLGKLFISDISEIYELIFKINNSDYIIGEDISKYIEKIDNIIMQIDNQT